MAELKKTYEVKLYDPTRQRPGFFIVDEIRGEHFQFKTVEAALAAIDRYADYNLSYKIYMNDVENHEYRRIE